MTIHQGLKKLHSTNQTEDYYSSVEWNKHSIGKIEDWPQSFKTALTIVINNSSAAILLWNKEVFTFPNELFLEYYLPNRELAEIKGISADQAIPELWNHIKFDVDNLYKHGKPFQKTVYLEGFDLPNETEYNMLSLNATPVHLEDESIGGVLITCMDVKPNYVMANELKEKIKEQEYIREIIKLQEKSNSIDFFLSEFASFIPSAMQFPNIAEASVEFDGNIYTSDHFIDCKTTIFTISHSVSGNELIINVAYTQETSHATKNSIYVQKDKNIVQTLAGQAALIIDRYLAKEDAKNVLKEKNQLLEAIPGGFLTLNSNWNITLMNANAEILLNKKRDELIGNNFWSLFPGFRSLTLLQAYKTAVKEKKVVFLKEYITPLNKWFDIALQPTENGLSTYFYDVSEEYAEKMKSDDLSTIIDVIQNGVVVTNHENRIKWVNQSFTKITGFSQKESAGKKPETLLSGPDTDLEIIQQISDKTSQQSAFSGEILSYTKAGEEIWLKLHITPVLDDAGEFKEFVTNLEDITRQKQTGQLFKKVQNMAKIGGWDYEIAGNQWFRGDKRTDFPDNNFVRVFDNIPDINERKLQESLYNRKYKLIESFLDQTDFAIWVAGSNKNIFLMNRKFKDMFGISQDEDAEKSIPDVFDDKTAGRFSQSIESVVSTSKPEIFEEKIITTAGEQVYAIFMYPTTAIANLDKAVIVASVNITELKQREKELKESVKDAETMLAEIHHRVKNNLAVVSGLMQLQSFNTDDKMFAELLNVSVSRIRSIAGIHEQLYQSENFSRIDLSKNLKRLVNEVIATMEVSVKIHQEMNLEPVQMTMEYATPFSLIVNEVITNILKHAFVGREEGTINMNLSEKDGQVFLEITDNGVGLPEDFDMKSSDSLGMELIQTLSDQLNAKFTYEGYTGGTRFTLLLENTENVTG